MRPQSRSRKIASDGNLVALRIRINGSFPRSLIIHRVVSLSAELVLAWLPMVSLLNSKSPDVASRRASLDVGLSRKSFWIADSRAARIERLYDAEAYLPLPIGRHAALVGNRMPGPTRQKAHDHTYCYHLDESFIRTQHDALNLPLTSF